MRSCEDYEALIHLAVDCELTAEEDRSLKAHFAQCPACREKYTQYLTMQAAFASLHAAPPVDLTATIMEKVQSDQKKQKARRKRTAMQWTAAAACCALVALGAYVQLAPNAGETADDAAAAKKPAMMTAMDSPDATRSITPANDMAAANQEEPSHVITLTSDDPRLLQWMQETLHTEETSSTLTPEQYAALETFLHDAAIPYTLTGTDDLSQISDNAVLKVVYEESAAE